MQVASAQMGTATDASRPCSEYHKSTFPEAFRHPCLFDTCWEGQGVYIYFRFCILKHSKNRNIIMNQSDTSMPIKL